MKLKLTMDLELAATHNISLFWSLPGEAFNETRHVAATGDPGKYIAFATLAGIYAEPLKEDTASEVVIPAYVVGCEFQSSVS